MVEPCLWQMLLSTQTEGGAEAVPAGSGGHCGDPSHRDAVSIPMHFGSIIHPSPACWDRAGGPGVGWERAELGG